MANGKNNWGVQYSRITFTQRILVQHGNTLGVERDHDIFFETERRNQGDAIRLLCVDEYTAGLAVVYKAREEFPDLNVLFVGGVWNGYTEEAKVFCVENEIGLFNASELNGALWQDDFWNYYRVDEEGNPAYPFKAA